MVDNKNKVSQKKKEPDGMAGITQLRSQYQNNSFHLSDSDCLAKQCLPWIVHSFYSYSDSFAGIRVI